MLKAKVPDIVVERLPDIVVERPPILLLPICRAAVEHRTSLTPFRGGPMARVDRTLLHPGWAGTRRLDTTTGVLPAKGIYPQPHAGSVESSPWRFPRACPCSAYLGATCAAEPIVCAARRPAAKRGHA